MLNSKLLRILRQLNENELDDFSDFIHSPFFNKNKKCIALFQLLQSYSPSFSAPEINDVQFAKDVYSNKKSLNTTIGKLLRLLEKYLTQQRFETQDELKEYLLLEELRERGEEKHYDLFLKQSMKKISRKKIDRPTFYGTYLLEVSQLKMLYQQRVSQEDKALQLEKTIRAFDKYVLSNHIWLDNTVLNTLELGSDAIEGITKEVVKDSAAFIDIARKKIYHSNPLIELQLLLRQLLEDKREENFDELFNKLKENHGFIGAEDSKHFHKFLVNYCIEKIYQGQIIYYKQLLDVYIFAMEIGSIIEGQYLAPFRMKNIIIASVKSNQIELAHSLMDQYIHAINPMYRNVTETYCRGYLHFTDKKYDKASDYLLQCVDMKNLFELDAQSILYKIYYETNEDWAFDIPVESFIIKLSRHRKRHPKNTIEGYINFFRILRLIYRKKGISNYNKTTEDILSRMNKMKFLSDKSWLREKLNELENHN